MIYRTRENQTITTKGQKTFNNKYYGGSKNNL